VSRDQSILLPKQHSSGFRFPNMVAKYVDPEGNEVGANKEGELWMAGPNIFCVCSFVAMLPLCTIDAGS